MAEQVALYKRTNVVQSQKFSEKIAQLMNSYYNGLITNEEVIKELLKLQKRLQISIRMVRNLDFHKKSWHFMMSLQNRSISRIFIRMMN